MDNELEIGGEGVCNAYTSYKVTAKRGKSTNELT